MYTRDIQTNKLLCSQNLKMTNEKSKPMNGGQSTAMNRCLVAKLDRQYVSCTVSYQELINFLLQPTRFQAMPMFGSSTIRHFATNASEMKKLAAHNFEDLLQVSQA